jgi:hypothetical protein
VPRGRHSAKVTSATNLTAPFAECHDTWQRFFYIFLKKFFAECLGAKHSTKIIFLKKIFVECLGARHSIKICFFLISLPSAGTRQRNGHFTECQPNTRQSWTLLGKMPSFA